MQYLVFFLALLYTAARIYATRLQYPQWIILGFEFISCTAFAISLVVQDPSAFIVFGSFCILKHMIIMLSARLTLRDNIKIQALLAHIIIIITATTFMGLFELGKKSAYWQYLALYLFVLADIIPPIAYPHPPPESPTIQPYSRLPKDAQV